MAVYPVSIVNQKEIVLSPETFGFLEGLRRYDDDASLFRLDGRLRARVDSDRRPVPSFHGGTNFLLAHRRCIEPEFIGTVFVVPQITCKLSEVKLAILQISSGMNSCHKRTGPMQCVLSGELFWSALALYLCFQEKKTTH